jgi:hypothetical protein
MHATRLNCGLLVVMSFAMLASLSAIVSHVRPPSRGQIVRMSARWSNVSWTTKAGDAVLWKQPDCSRRQDPSSIASRFDDLPVPHCKAWCKDATACFLGVTQYGGADLHCHKTMLGEDLAVCSCQG